MLSHLPLDRDEEVIKISDDVELQYYRSERIFSGPIDVEEGEDRQVKSPIETVTGSARDDKTPLSELIEVLNEGFDTDFGEEHRLFFHRIKTKASNNNPGMQMAIANPLDRFELGTWQLIQGLMIEFMTDNDQLVTRNLEDDELQSVAFSFLEKTIFDAARPKDSTLIRWASTECIDPEHATETVPPALHRLCIWFSGRPSQRQVLHHLDRM